MTAKHDWSDFRIEEEGRVLLVPCLTFTLYLDETEAGPLQDWYDRAMTGIGQRLTHYVAENMVRQSNLTARARGMFPMWL